jgi:cytochrome c5
MKAFATLALIVSVASVVACGKSEEAAVPAAPAPAAQTPSPAPVEPAATPAPAAEAAAVVEVVPAAVPPVAPAAVATPAAPVPAPKPARPPETPTPAAPVPAPTPVADLLHGQKIYRQACAFCHDRGVAGAPKTGDAAAWTARLAQGADTLYAAAVRGKGAMPAKGGNPALSEADVKAAVDFMLAQSR